MKDIIKIAERYLWFPIKVDVPDTTIAIYNGDRKIQELYIGISEGEPDFYAWFDAKSFMGSEFSLEGDYKDEWFKKVRVADEKPLNPTKNRPLIHYAPSFGWLNDPNGLIYHNGIYHIYHQHNPYGVKWENIHWAHTQTTDFIHFTQTEDVLMPDEEGPIFSGTAILDKQNHLGLGADVIAYFYTSAGGRSRWSLRHPFTQKMAVSTDDGKTLIKSDKFILPHIKEENRDPKVFYHEESKSYIMILYISDNTFYFFRSGDLLQWKKIQELTVPGMWECPDFFPLTCKEDKTKKWVLWSADGYYCLGDFDGMLFYPDVEPERNQIKRQAMYALIMDKENRVDRQFVRAYAAQTFYGVNDRILQLSWITSMKKDKNYAGLLSLPAELSLCSTDEGYRISMNPAQEMENLRKETYETVLGSHSEKHQFYNKNLYTGEKQPIEIEINITQMLNKDAYLKLSVFQTILEIDMMEEELKIGPYKIGLLKGKRNHIRLYADIDILEIFACGGLNYAVVNNESDSLSGTIDMQYSGMSGDIKLHVLNSLRFEGGEHDV